MISVNTTEITRSQIDEVVSIVRRIHDIIEREESKRPFNINIIDELHADENAHTRILIKLLQYTSHDTYPILSSFIRMTNGILAEESNGELISTCVSFPTITYGEDFIDGLIVNKGQAIIIENKIHYAIDQDAQIERYIKTVLNKYDVEHENVFVIYLTRNGTKEVQDYSFTPWAKRILGTMKDSSGRFIKMNYRDHIIGWLKNDVLPNCALKEDQLISALKQYIDHIEGLTLTRENDKNMNKEIQRYLLESLSIDTRSNEALWRSLTNEADKLQGILDIMDNIKKEISDRAYNSLNTYSVEALSEITSDSNEWRFDKGGNYAQLINCNWDKNIHFEWYPLSANDFAQPNFEFRLGFHLEGKHDRNHVNPGLFATINHIPSIEIFSSPNAKLKHKSALFEKSYCFGTTPFIDASEDRKKEFIYGAINEFKIFILTIKKYINEGR